MPPQHELGTIAASEQLLRDLYLDLRVKIAEWADLTKQTAQARMGYVGQHLVSVVTGLPGGRSGARGRDLVRPDGGHSEIKTCYRVDQLGKCRTCDARVAAIEDQCPECESTEINRMDDSKWLIGVRHDSEFEEILSPHRYYLVLFDFVDLEDPTEIRASIYEVDPNAPGFSMCMVDYYKNIRANSKSKAPFNLWPYELKFALMKPVCIYRAILDIDEGTIHTSLFPGRDPGEQYRLAPLHDYSRSQNLKLDRVHALAQRLGVDVPADATKKVCLEHVEAARQGGSFTEDELMDALCDALYSERVSPHIEELPVVLREALPRYQA